VDFGLDGVCISNWEGVRVEVGGAGYELGGLGRNGGDLRGSL